MQGIIRRVQKAAGDEAVYIERSEGGHSIDIIWDEKAELVLAVVRRLNCLERIYGFARAIRLQVDLGLTGNVLIEWSK